MEYHDFETGTVCTFPKGMHFLLNEEVNPFALCTTSRTGRRSCHSCCAGPTADPGHLRHGGHRQEPEREEPLPLEDGELHGPCNPKLIGPEDALTDEGKVALASSDMIAYVSVDRSQDPKSVSPMMPPPLQPEVFNMNDRIDNEIREACGVNELMRGLFPDRKRTATETNEVVSASAARQSEKRNTLAEFHEDIAERILTLMQMFYDQARMVRYIDPVAFGEVPWEWSGADIIGEFNLQAHLSPREAYTRDALRQEAVVLLNVLAPFAEPDAQGKSALHKESLIAWFARKYGISKREMNELMQSPEEQQVQAAGAMQQAAGGPPPGPLSPQQLVAAANGPNISTDALGVQGPPTGGGGVGP